MDKEWKNSLRERFSDYSVPEPEGLWEGIEQGMAEKKRRKLLPVWLVSGAAVAAAVALVVFLHPDKKVESPAPFDVASHNTVVSDVIPDTSVPIPTSDETIPDAVHKIVPHAEEPAIPSSPVYGIIVDKNGEPIYDGSVIMRSNQTVGSMSDKQGRFSLNVPIGTELEVSALGYLPVSVSAQAGMRIVLEEDEEFLGPTVIVDYATDPSKPASKTKDFIENKEAPSSIDARVYGTVVDSEGYPVVCASVIPERVYSLQGKMTDYEGRFSLDVPEGTELEVSALGYLPVTVSAKAGMRVVLEEDDTVMKKTAMVFDESPVIGYGAGGRGGFSVGAYRSGGQEASEQSQGFGLNQSKGAYRTRSFGNGKKQDTGSLMEMLSSNKLSSYEEHHDAPVRVGVTFAWEMTPHLSLASGLNWTSLNSTFEESTSSVRNYTRQELGYLGVPLRLEAGFQPWKGLRLYAGAGGMVEKNLLAHSVTSYYVGDYLEESVGHRLNTGGLLWSVGASAGAEYRFNRVLGLYFAPGIEYHFDNGAAVKSAYTVNQLHWNVSLGVRFNFGK